MAEGGIGRAALLLGIDHAGGGRNARDAGTRVWRSMCVSGGREIPVCLGQVGRLGLSARE